MLFLKINRKKKLKRCKKKVNIVDKEEGVWSNRYIFRKGKR